MASTSTSVYDDDSTIPWVDEPMLAMDTTDDDTTSCEDEDESMMPVDNEEDQIDDNVAEDDETMLPVEEADDAAAMCLLPDLPIRNILSRVPPSSATRFKVVSKSWRSMIAAARTHRAAAAARSVLLVDADADAPCPVTVVGGFDETGDSNGEARLALRPCRRTPRHGYAVQNCCGPLTCLRGGRRDAEILNPATGESLGLGHFFRHGEPSTWTPAENFPWYCLGRCSGGGGAGGGEYKVVRLDVRVPSTRRPVVTFEVLSLGRESWHDPSSSGSLAFAPEWKPVGAKHVSCSPTGRGVHVDGAVYYLALSVAGAMVVSFDLATHQLGEVDLPPAAVVADEAGGGGAAPSLSELDGRLCLSLVRASGEETRRGGATGAAATMDIYVLGDDTDGGGGRAWFQVGRIGLDVAARRAPRPLLLRGGRMLMKRADGSLCYYGMEGGSGVGGAAGEEVVYEHKGCPRRKEQQLSGVTADVFVESPLPLQAILLGA